jgi:hypothetical protein
LVDSKNAKDNDPTSARNTKLNSIIFIDFNILF